MQSEADIEAEMAEQAKQTASIAFPQRLEWLNAGLLAYIFFAYGCGLALIVCPADVAFGSANALGVIAIAHALVLSAALVHELIHDNIFKEKSQNAFWGQVMTWLNGACYVPYEQLVRHHFNHHVYHADFVPFDIQSAIAQLPARR